MICDTRASLLLFATAFLLVGGFSHGGDRLKRDAPPGDDCMNPPKNTEMEQCCQPPKEHIWGHLRKSIRMCVKKLKEEGHMSAEGDDDGAARSEGTPEEKGGWDGSRRRLFHRKLNKDGCLVECVFQNEGFLMDNKVNKQAILDRLQMTLGKNMVWSKVAVAAVEKCLSTDVERNSNFTCKSGSEENLLCVYKEMFLGCPTWLEGSNYCESLRGFYQRCPNGPPPDGFLKPKNRYRKEYNPSDDSDGYDDDGGEPNKPEDKTKG